MPIHHPADSKYDYLRVYLVDETIEDYQENRIGRREMLRRVLLLTGSIPLTASILSACTTAAPTSPTPAATSGTSGAASPAASPGAVKAPPPASPAAKTAASPSPASKTAASPSPNPSPRSAVTVPPTDPAIEAREVQFSGPAGTVYGYFSTPRGASSVPGIIVIHENRGVTEHIRDMTRRYAKDDIAALAVDLLSRAGGSERVTDTAQIQAALSQANQMDLVRDLMAGVDYLQAQPIVAGSEVGVVGYCYGGGMTWLLAVNSSDIGAAVPYYGAPPQPIDQVQNITAPVLAFYGENDRRINQNIPAIEEAMSRYNKEFEMVVYPGAGHAFNNDTGQNYNAAAARDAYQRSVAFFKEHLRP